MTDRVKVYRGNIVFTKNPQRFTCVERGFIVVDGEKVLDVFDRLPEAYTDVAVTDFGDRLILPGFVDLHLHASQFANLGIGFDMELLPWLTTYTFPEESKFSDIAYARQVYARFADELVKHGTTRAAVFATVHTQAVEALFELLAARGIAAYVGRVNMDRNGDTLTETTADSLRETEDWLKRCQSPTAKIKPILTPRFMPSCSDELMQALGALAKKYNTPVQSHISENPDEVAWVKSLAPTALHYADTYDQAGLFGQTPTLMAHCVYLTEQEIELMRDNGVYAVHCPTSNMNVASGIAPVRRLLDAGVTVALGTDISGGHSMSMLSAIAAAVQMSKMYTAMIDRSAAPLALSEAFYMATKAGGGFFAPSPSGSFEPGYDFDALVIDDSELPGMNARSPEERVERYIYNGSHTHIHKRFAFGNEI